MGRLTDTDSVFGPLTVARTDWKRLSVVWSSGGDWYNEGERVRNDLTIYAFGWIMRLYLPFILRPLQVRHSWIDGNGEQRGYSETFAREYGFSHSDDSVTIYYGPQTHGSDTTLSKFFFVPWLQWRRVRETIFDPNGSVFFTQTDNDYEKRNVAEELVPKVKFLFADYDEEMNIATCHLSESEYRLGEGWFKWLSIFKKPRIHPALNIKFEKESGRGKGSWKGGTMACYSPCAAGETVESAFIEYCAKHDMTLCERVE